MDFNEAFDLTAQNMAAQIFLQSPQVQMILEELAIAQCDTDCEQAKQAMINVHVLAKAACYISCTYRVAIENEKARYN